MHQLVVVIYQVAVAGSQLANLLSIKRHFHEFILLQLSYFHILMVLA